VTPPPAIAEDASWLAGASAVVALAIPVDGEAAILAEGRRYARHPQPMSAQLYELRRGLPRLLALLRDLELRATFFIPGLTIERHPAATAAVLDGGHELAHHSYAHRRPVDLTESEQRADFERALAALAKAGVTPAGHRAAAWAPTVRTLQLVHEHGLLYDNSLMGDDRPYRVQLDAGSVLELPSHYLTDDLEQYGYQPEPLIGRTLESPHTATAVWRAELDAMTRFGALCQLTCHAYLSGRPGRALALRRLLEEVRARPDVDILTCGEVARRAARDPAIVTRPCPSAAPVSAAAAITEGA
jgi:peptidoglycan/xylan/chitin deacetylase (PgdA/CDA1 family)